MVECFGKGTKKARQESTGMAFLTVVNVSERAQKRPWIKSYH
jgi:hypothetical protein